jgi:hypothetical protein
MSSRQTSSAPAHVKTSSNPREARSDPLCSENIDAQIRWFFENASVEANILPREDALAHP